MKTSYPGIRLDNPAEDPVVGTEWIAKTSVNEKTDFLEVEENESVEGRAGGLGPSVK